MTVAIIGAGISGLACAFRLKQAGVAVVLLEAAGRVGGVIQTVEEEDFLFELGPQSFLSNEPALELIRAVGLQGELLQADRRAARFILLGGRLHPAPMAPPLLLATPLLSRRTKLRLFTEPFRRSRPPEEDESVSDFARRKFGADLLENLLGPFVSGIYAGDPERLSLRSAFPFVHRWEKDYGSVIRGALKSRPPKDRPRPGLCSFPRGMATLVRALGDALGDSLRLQTKALSLEPIRTDGSARIQVHVESHGAREALSASAVVLATPAAATVGLLRSMGAGATPAPDDIPYAPVAVVSTVYRREQVQHPLEGFGFLVPRKEGLRTLGTVWNSSLFPRRAPEGFVNLASFVGGATDPAVADLAEPELAAIVEKEIGRVLGIQGPMVKRRVQVYPRALPQYNLGHGERVASLRAAVESFPGVFLTGNYLEGPAVGACVEHAFRVAESVRQSLSNA